VGPRAVLDRKKFSVPAGNRSSPLSFKVMAFEGEVPVRSKTAARNAIVEQVYTFICWRARFLTKL
jgi:hypothetical protein